MNFTEVQQKLEITQKELDATKTLLTSTRIELSQTKSTVDDLTLDLTTILNGKMINLKSVYNIRLIKL
jgi:hypothetical protein